jgi:hypothetical protein
MAVVGRAEIIVRAVTTGIKDDIRKGLAGSAGVAETAGSDVSKSFNRGLRSNDVSKSFNKFKQETEQLGKAFFQAIRTSYKFQAAAGALLQSIMALGGGILALSGNMLGAAASGVALIGLMAQMKLASVVAKQAFSGIMQSVKASSSGSQKSIRELREEMQQLAFDAEEAALAEEGAALSLEKAREELARSQSLPPDNRARREAELAYQKAELAYRKAKDKNKDLQEEIDNPKKKAGTDPFADLTKTQRVFAVYLKSVMPRMKELKEAAASSFLPELQKQMEVMFKSGYFDMLVGGFREVSGGLARAVKSFAGTLFDPKNKSNLADFFKSTATNLGSFGSIIGNVFAGFLGLMKNIDPLIGRLAIFLNRKSSNFAKDMTANSASITSFFKLAGDAAAGWGKILGNLWSRFKGFIKANIGPGTGGQLLLDWLKGGTDAFRGLDGAAGEYARKNHFLASAENLKAMLQSIGKIFGFLSDIGTSPEVMVFWKTLEGLEEPFKRIFEGITGSAEELAKLLVSVVEIFASFADSAQLNAYLSVLSTIANVAANTLEALRPLFQLFGPLVGAIGAFISILLISKKVLQLLVYPILLITNGYVALTKVILVLRGAFVAYNVVKGFALAQEKSGIILSAVQRAGIYKEIIAKTLATKATLAQSIAIGMNTAKTSAAAIAGGTLATTNAAVGATATASIGPIATMGVTLLTSLAPILPIVLAIAAVIAAITAGIIIYNSIKTDNAKRALKSLSTSFEENKQKSMGAAEAQKSWQSSLIAVDGAARNGIENVRDLGKVLNETRVGARGMTVVSNEAGAASEALGTYMKGLSKLAKKSLPDAQREFRNLVVVGKLNRKATTDAILKNEEYVAALEKQANAMGDTIKKADGQVDAIKAVDYALGEGSYLRRIAALENQKLAQSYKDAAASFIDTNSAMQKATDGNTFSLKKYLSEIRSQGDKLSKWRTNLAAIRTVFTDPKLYNDIVKMGAAGADLVNSLANTDATKMAQNIKDYEAALKAAGGSSEDVEAFGRATTNTAAVIKAAAAGGRNMADAAQRMAAAGLSSLEIQMKLGISNDAILAAQKEIDKKLPDLAAKVNVQAGWDEGTIDGLKGSLVDKFGSATLNLKATAVTGATGGKPKPTGWATWDVNRRAEWIRVNGPPVKNGGLLTSSGVKRYANGGLLPRFFNGGATQMYPNGMLSGPGGPRTDSILARVSTGEFVVNAAATRRNLDLLQAINSNKTISGETSTTNNNISINVNAAPGMNEQEVASLVSQKLNFELSRGMNA